MVVNSSTGSIIQDGLMPSLPFSIAGLQCYHLRASKQRQIPVRSSLHIFHKVGVIPSLPLSMAGLHCYHLRASKQRRIPVRLYARFSPHNFSPAHLGGVTIGGYKGCQRIRRDPLCQFRGTRASLEIRTSLKFHF